MEKVEENLNKGVFVKDVEWSGKEVEYLNDRHFLTAKPIVYLVNIGDI